MADRPEATSVELAAETLSGDVRDALLTKIRTLQKPWQQMSEREQRDLNWFIEETAKDLVRRVVNVVTSSEFPSVHVEVGAFKIDKGVEIKLTASGTVGNITALAEHGKRAAVLALVAPSDFIGERGPAAVEKDQRELAVDDDGDFEDGEAEAA